MSTRSIETSAVHGPGRTVASAELGAVHVCGCGVVTLNLQYLSLRFERAAFDALVALLILAQVRIEGLGMIPESSPCEPAEPADQPARHDVH